jgi:superfamily I DNA and RNA helicase
MNETWWVGFEQLDADQKAIISLPLKGSHLIIGPPGSGKTNLLLLRANYTFLSGCKNILVVVFTRTLRDFIASGARHYTFPMHKLTTCRRWQLNLLYEYGEKVILPEGDFDEQREFFVTKVNKLISTKKLENIYDALFLDESQDYTPEEILIFKRLGKVLFAVTDSKQKIYPSKDSLDTIKSLVDYIHPLRYHYRNGLAICKFADAIAKDSFDYEKLAETSNYDEVARPSYPDELLCVISPRKEELSGIWEVVQESKIAGQCILQSSDGYISLSTISCVFFCSLHAVKGLEARAVHIAGCEFLKHFPHNRNMAFTAVTRAKTSLTLYFSNALPGYLEQAIQSLQPLPNLPEMKDVFGGRK